MSVKGQKEMEIQEYIKTLGGIGLAKETRDFILKIEKRNKKILQTINNSLTTPNLKAAFRELVHRRIRELSAAVKEIEGGIS